MITVETKGVSILLTSAVLAAARFLSSRQSVRHKPVFSENVWFWVLRLLFTYFTAC